MFTQLKQVTNRGQFIGKAKRASRVGIHLTLIFSMLVGPVASAKPPGKSATYLQSYADSLSGQAVAESIAFLQDDRCTKAQDPLRCLGGEVEKINGSVERKLRDLHDRVTQSGKSEENAKYKDLKITDLKDGNWKSFFKDISDLLQKKGIKSPAEATAMYPEIGATLAELAKLEGALVAFQITGFDYPGDNKNFCHMTEGLAGGIFDQKQRTALAIKLIGTDKTEVDAMAIAMKPMKCEVACTMNKGSWICTPDKEGTQIAYGAKSMTDFTVDCFDELKGCNPDGTRSTDTSGNGTVPMAPGSVGFVAAYAAAEEGFTERSNEFLMSTMMSSYIKLAKLNARDDKEMATMLQGLNKQLNACGDAENASATLDESTAKAHANLSGGKHDEMGTRGGAIAGKRESARKKREIAKKKKLEGAVSVQKYASAQINATLKDLAEKGDISSARNSYQGRMAQAAQCTQRLADRALKLQILLYDNATARGKGPQHAKSLGGKVLDFVVNMATPSLHTKLVEMSGSLPSIDRATTLDGDRLQPICGGWSELFTKNVLSDKDKIQLSLEGEKFEVNRYNIDKLCNKLQQEEELMLSELEGIYNEYPTLFNANSHMTRTSVANEIMANMDSSKTNPHVPGYRKNKPMFPKSTYVCQASEGGKPTGRPVLDASGSPVSAEKCGDKLESCVGQDGQAIAGITTVKACQQVKGAKANRLMAFSLDFSKDPAFNGVGEGFDKSKGEPSCMDIAKASEPTDAHIKAADIALSKNAKPTMEKLGKEIMKMACGDQGPDFYRDAVVGDDKLFGMYVGCDDRKMASSNAVETQNTCEDRKTDKWMACVRRKTKTAAEGEKKLEESGTKEQKVATANMISGVMTAAEGAFAASSMFRPMLGGAFRPFAGGAKVAAKRMGMSIGMGVGFGGGILALTNAAGLMPSQAEIDSLKNEAGWNDAMVAVGYGSARKASQSVRAALEMENQPNQFLDSMVMAVVMGAVGGSYIHSLDDIAMDNARRLAKANAKKAMKAGGRLTKAELEEIAGSVGKLASLDPASTLQMFKQWKAEVSATHGASKLAKAEKVLAQALNQEILRKYAANLDSIPLNKLSVEDRFKLLTDPELLKISSFPTRLALFMDPQFQHMPIEARVKVYTDPEVLKVGDLKERIAKVEAQYVAKTDVVNSRGTAAAKNKAAYVDARYSPKSFDDYKVKMDKIARGNDPLEYSQGLNLLFLGLEGKELSAAMRLLGGKTKDRAKVLAKYMDTPEAKAAYAKVMPESKTIGVDQERFIEPGTRTFSEKLYNKLKAEEGGEEWVAQYVKVATADLSQTYGMDFFKVLKNEEDVVALLAYEERIRGRAAEDPDFRLGKARDDAKNVVNCCNGKKSACPATAASLDLELPNGQMIAACTAPEKWWN